MTSPTFTGSGILLVDKPAGLTSHDVVARSRKILGTRKIGHAGTLDPMATGLLVLGVNSSTRLLTFLVGLDKQYSATIRLGAGSTTDDAEGEIDARADDAALAAATDDAIHAGVARLTGDIRQRPSSVSAIKVDGKRAYALVREGEEVVLAERAVTIAAFEVLAVRRADWVDVDVRVDCSSGTYIRALARDLGADLAVGGHLTALRRTRIGPFRVEESSALEEGLRDHLIAPAEAAARVMPTVTLDAATAVELAQGKRVPLEAEPGPRAALDPDGRLIGLIESVDGRARILVNFPTGEASL